jgi:glycosyltransferase involved in cell wall biosynthesis
MTRTRILYCINTMWPGGTENQLANLIKRLDRDRFEPAICVLRPGTIDLSGLDCPSIILSFTALRSVHGAGCVLRLRRFITRHRFDVMHSFFADPSLLGYLASVGTSVRVRVGSIRDLGFWRTPGQRAMFRCLYPFFDGFISNSRIGALTAHKDDGIPLEKIRVIPNGIEVPVDSSEGSKDGPLVGVVANMSQRVKRIDLFLEAAALVRRQRPDARFAIVGNGPLRPGLEKHAADLGLAEHVHFVGPVADAQPWVKSFDVGVSCSDSEGLSNAIIEFMAWGVPAVARRVGGNPELLTNEETGLLVDSDQPGPIATAILRLLSDADLRRRMGARARDVVAARHNWETCVHQHEQYYTHLMDRRVLTASVAMRRAL